VTESVSQLFLVFLTEVRCELQVTYDPRMKEDDFPRDLMKSIAGRQPRISELVLQAKEGPGNMFFQPKTNVSDCFGGTVGLRY